MSRTSSAPRGFSLLVVLLALLMMGVIGTLAATIGISDRGTAGAREKRAQAMLAAESGFYLLTVSGDASTIADKIEEKKNLFTELPALDTDHDGLGDLRTGYFVSRIGNVFFVEGRLLETDGRVIGRARLAGRVKSFSGRNGYEGQEGNNPRSTGVVDHRDDYEREVVTVPL